ncbi:hypothetical protein OSB04_029877 [Centaurea solstitialis]|uniref:40S ribosomal protein S15 n=1 Tax=Centaurea solstitialis TaxID=347529 RepID=A0AA38S7P6_9ASTR|nr:hypothetical protein OSB04_029877 [Centaurea solstitialis]
MVAALPQTNPSCKQILFLISQQQQGNNGGDSNSIITHPHRESIVIINFCTLIKKKIIDFGVCYRRMWRLMLRRPEFQRRGRLRSSVSEEWIWMLSLICLRMTLSSSSLLVLAEGMHFLLYTTILFFHFHFLIIIDFHSFIIIIDRFQRGLKRKPMALIKKLRKAKREAPAGEKPELVKTHLRNMIIVPEMIGSVIGVYNGKTFNQIEIKPEMIGHYLAEFSISYKPVKHGRPGIGATHSSRFIPLK